jgi:hypothetical protein
LGDRENELFLLHRWLKLIPKGNREKLKNAVTISENWIILIKGVFCINPKSDSNQQ